MSKGSARQAVEHRPAVPSRDVPLTSEGPCQPAAVGDHADIARTVGNLPGFTNWNTGRKWFCKGVPDFGHPTFLKERAEREGIEHWRGRESLNR